jgi:hypothetical protein
MPRLYKTPYIIANTPFVIASETKQSRESPPQKPVFACCLPIFPKIINKKMRIYAIEFSSNKTAVQPFDNQYLIKCKTRNCLIINGGGGGVDIIHL